ncbi:MAG: hypothetical protein JST43_03325 [Bacteroidetes bacterium]|nr:hypothetical protein [Bacteroidota bacterium]MBS1540242.1 hypothetical protein [Bacteroidota bacterium]
MKIIAALVICLNLLTCAVATWASSPHKSVRILSAKENLFVMKVDKEWQNAHVEVLAVNGDCVTCQLLTRSKLVINFQDVKQGLYTIRVTKGDQAEEFHFTKN